MDYYEHVVIDYLRADRAIFVNTGCCIQLNPAENPDTSGPHWYCDAVACDFRAEQIFLCEISYSKQLTALSKRLDEWSKNWDGVCSALARDGFLPTGWPVRPWLFVLECRISTLLKKFEQTCGNNQSPWCAPRITPLEMVQPWKYCSWNRVGECTKPTIIPEAMQT